MKSFLVIAFVAVVVTVKAAKLDVSDAFIEKAKQCRIDFVIPDEEFENLKAGEFFEVDETSKCFVNCLHEKLGVLKDGVFQEDVLLAKLSGIIGEEKTKVVIEACKAVSGSGECETAFKMHQCFKQIYAD